MIKAKGLHENHTLPGRSGWTSLAFIEKNVNNGGAPLDVDRI